MLPSLYHHYFHSQHHNRRHHHHHTYHHIIITIIITIIINILTFCIASWRTYYNFAVCDLPLGMESGEIGDSQLNASSVYSKQYFHQPFSARLHNQGSHWRPRKNSRGEWLQIDFIERVAVTKVATQGAGKIHIKHWVTSYKLSFSEDAASWVYFKENGEEKVRTLQIYSLEVREPLLR